MSTESLSASLCETLSHFETAGEPLTTSEVATHLDLGRRSTYERLERLVEEDELRTKKVGASARVWWRPKGPPAHSGGDHGESGSQPVPNSLSVAQSLVEDLGHDRTVGAFVLDDEFRVAWIDDEIERYFGIERAAVVGREKRAVLETAIAPAIEDSTTFAETVLGTYDDNTYNERFECHVVPGDGREERWLEHRSRPIHSGEFAGGRVELYYDISDAVTHERELKRQASLLDNLFEQVPVNLYLKDRQGRHLRTSTPYLRDEYPDEEFFQGKTDLDIYPEGIATTAYEDDMHVIESGEPIIEKLEFDPSNEDWLLTSKVPWRDDDDTIRGLIGVSRIITEQKETEIALERHREQLAALNSLNELVQEIIGAVIDQSTREEIETTVCENLADADSYSFAWVGDVDATSQTVSLRTGAGLDGYLDDVTITVDPDDERSEGPTGRAFRTGEVQTATNVQDGDSHAPWREHVERHDVRSSAAIPIVHEDSVFGVLNVYADRPNAFEGEERTVVSQLGEVMGHAIAAAERKRALLSDEVVELDFQIPNVFADLPVEAVADDVSLQRALSLEDDAYVVYGSVDADSTDAVELLTDAVSHWESVSFQDADGDEEVRFEMQLSESPLLSTLASLGGSVEKAVIEDGDYLLRVQIGADADVRQVIDAVQAAYPEAEMLRRQQTTRRDDRDDRVERVLSAELTDRQRTALDAAYHAGFFDWPRQASGGDVAASLDVAPPTFHQHLRKAERKVFDALLSESSFSS